RILMAGDAAVHAAGTGPLAVEPSPKRRMDEHEVLLAGMFVPVTDLAAAVLAEALTRAAQFTGEFAESLVLTYPDHWGAALQQKLASAGEIAGIDLQGIQLVGEAAAAAGYYTKTGGGVALGARIAIVDSGASHCGVAVLDKGPDGNFAVVAADGFGNLSGLALDARIHAWVMRRLAELNPALAAELSDSSNVTVRLRLTDSIRIAKESLSFATSAMVEASGANGSESLQLTRGEFDRLISADIDRAVQLTESILYHANTIRQVTDPVTIHLTGGSSRVPLLQTRLASLGRVDVVDNPKSVLTHGALSANPSPQQWQSVKLPDLPSPAKGRKNRRSPIEAGAAGDTERTRRRQHRMSTARKWGAGIGLVAIVGSGIGVAGTMIYQGFFTSKPTPQATSPAPLPTAPLTPKMPTPLEFQVGVIVTETQCPPGSPVCTYKYTVEPKYVGQHPLPQTPFTVSYEVVGGNAPQPGEFTVHKDQAKILKDVLLDGPPAAQLRANVIQVKEAPVPPPPPPGSPPDGGAAPPSGPVPPPP
ncbi:MAG TPA: Hsp70 family protein, partial [Mycobacterium sp.]|nr:Hsp70 family protein [Mycobacterium sp.]